MTKIRISHFTSSVCAFVLALIFLLGAPILVEAVKSDPSKQSEADVIVALYFLAYLGVGVFLCIAFMEAKYYVLTKEGISVCLLGISYRKLKWENIYDVTIGPDPLRKYAVQTLLLNSRPGKKYYPRIGTPSSLREPGSSMYEKSFYKDLFLGRLICLRCGKKLDSVLMLLNEHVSADVMQQMRRF